MTINEFLEQSAATLYAQGWTNGFMTALVALTIVLAATIIIREYRTDAKEAKRHELAIDEAIDLANSHSN